MNSEQKIMNRSSTELWNAGEISNCLENEGLEVHYDGLDQNKNRYSLVQGMDGEVNYNVFNLGTPEETDLKAVMSFKYKDEVGENSIFSQPSLGDILQQLGNPDLVDVKSDDGRIYVTSDLSSAAPGAIAEEFAEVYSEVKDSGILGH